MKVHVLAVLSREPNGQTYQDRCILDTIIEVETPDLIREGIADWLKRILREEPTSTKLLSLSHMQVT